MAERFLVAVGGTGQNVALALSRLVAIGAVRDNIELRAIDSDNKGDLSQLLRTSSLLFPGLERPGADPHPLHNPVVTAPFDLSSIKDAVFSQLFIDPNEKHPLERELFEALFDDDLGSTRVHEGMFGRPAVGATVFANGVQSGFLEKLLRPMAQAQAIYVTGSFVGGTGAGTMHKLVRNLRDAYAGPLYGLFFLPWFRLESGRSAVGGITEQGLIRNAEHGLRYFYDETKDRLDVSMLIGQPQDRQGSRVLTERTAGRAETPSYLHVAGAWGLLQLSEIKNKEPETRVVALGHRLDAEDWLLEQTWETGVTLRRRLHAHLALQESLKFLMEQEKNIRAPYESMFASSKNLGTAFDESVKANCDKDQREGFVGAVLAEWGQQAMRLRFIVGYFQEIFTTELIRKSAANELLDTAPTWETIRASWDAAGASGASKQQGEKRKTPEAVAELFANAILQKALKG